MIESGRDEIKKKVSLASAEELSQPVLKEAPLDDATSEQYELTSSQGPATMIGDLAKSMPSRKSGKKKEDSAEPLTKLPRLFVGLIYVAFLSIAFLAIGSASGTQLPRLLWAALPLQVFFTFCLFRINEIVGLKRKGPPAINPALVGLISVVSFTCMPLTGYYYNYFSRLADPFFFLWFIAQISWPLLISRGLESSFSLKRLVTMLFCASIPSLLLMNGNISIESAGIVNFSWLFTQFGFLFYFSLRLKEIYEHDLKILSAKKVAKKGQIKGVAKDDIVIRYHAFAEVERWLRQRFTGGSLLKGTRLFLLWLSIPVIGVLLLLGLVSMDIALRYANIAAANTPATIQLISATNGLFIKGFLLFVFTLIAIPAVAFLKAPSHLLLNRDGMRFLWRHGKFSKDGNSLKWNELSSIDLERPKGSTQALDQFLRFHGSDGTTQKIKLNAIESVDEREKILAMIHSWAPNVPREPEVEQCLLPPADHSYTEMWLQALAAPPKRERMKPLLENAVLKQGKYTILHSLGVGGQGSAYLALDNINDDQIVLKEFILPVHVDVNVRKSALEQFENEARILRQLDTRNIVKLIDFFVEDHRAYLVLEHIDGMSLREFVEQKGALEEGQVRDLSIQMCEILSYLHALTPPVVHRDFTPDNLILQHDGTLKLIDFNVAQQVEATVTGTVVGKHAYLPPEQFRGMPTTQSDIYAMGATMHYLLTGSDPEPISRSQPAKQVPGLSAGIDHIVSSATHLDCGVRYQSIEQLAEDLKRLT